jgi:hypothetical protein
MKVHNWERNPRYDILKGNIEFKDSFRLLKSYICKRCGIKCIDKYLDMGCKNQIPQDCDLVIIQEIQKS